MSGETVTVTMSFGIAEYPSYPNVDALVAAADAALYQAKRSGKNTVAQATVLHGTPEDAEAEPALPFAALA